MDKVCLLLPAYNEAGRVESVVRGALSARIDDAEIEVIVVDDGSADDTVRRARAAGARVVSLGEHLGVGAALRRGFELARLEGFDFLVHIDADGQIDPAQIPAVLAPVRRGAADVAIGSRFLDGAPDYLAPWKARALRVLAALVGAAVEAPLTDLSCGIRALNAAAVEVARPRFKSDYVQETLLQFFGAGLRVTEVPVTAVGRGGPRGLSARTLRYTATYLLLLGYGLARFYFARPKCAPAPAPLGA